MFCQEMRKYNRDANEEFVEKVVKRKDTRKIYTIFRSNQSFTVHDTTIQVYNL